MTALPDRNNIRHQQNSLEAGEVLPHTIQDSIVQVYGDNTLHKRASKSATGPPKTKSTTISKPDLQTLIGTDVGDRRFLWKGAMFFMKTPKGKPIDGALKATAAQVKEISNLIWTTEWKGVPPPKAKVKTQADLVKMLGNSMMASPGIPAKGNAGAQPTGGPRKTSGGQPASPGAKRGAGGSGKKSSGGSGPSN